MELPDIEIQGRKCIKLPWEPIWVYPIGDVQLGQQGCDKRRLKEHIKEGLDRGAWFLGMGDMTDVLSPGNRQSYRSSSMYETARQAMVDMAERSVEELLGLFKGTEGKWLGMLHGDHFFPFEDGTTTDTRLAQALGATYLGSCSMIGLTFARGKCRQRYVIFCHHGCGNGIMPFSPLNKLYHVMNSFEADAYFIGHQHKMPSVSIPRMYLSDQPPYRLIAKIKRLAGTGGWFEGYHVGSTAPGTDRPEGSYVEQGLLPPVAIGGVRLLIKPTHRHDRDFIDARLET